MADLALETEFALRKGFFGPGLLDDHGHVVVFFFVVVGGHGGQVFGQLVDKGLKVVLSVSVSRVKRKRLTDC